MDREVPMENSRQTVTVPEAANILGIGRSGAYEAVRHGQIPALKIGHRILVPIAALERMLEVTPGTLSKAGTKATTPPRGALD